MENKPEIQNEKNKIVALLERIFKQIKNNDIKGVDQSIELANSLISQLPGALKDQSRYKNRLTDLVKQKEATVANEGNTDAWTDVNVWMSYKSPNQTGFDYIVLSEDYDIPIMTSEPDTVPIDPAPMSTDSTDMTALMTEVTSKIPPIHVTYIENYLQQSIQIQVADFMAWLSNPNRANFSHQYNNLMSQVERTMVRALNAKSAEMIQIDGNQEKKTILPLTKANVAAEQEKQSTVLNNKNISNALKGLQLLFILFQVSRLMYAFNSIRSLNSRPESAVDNTSTNAGAADTDTEAQVVPVQAVAGQGQEQEQEQVPVQEPAAAAAAAAAAVKRLLGALNTIISSMEKNTKFNTQDFKERLWSGEGSGKLAALKKVEAYLQGTAPDVEKAKSITQQICAYKRNPLGIFEPHSLRQLKKEFPELKTQDVTPLKTDDIKKIASLDLETYLKRDSMPP